MTILRNIRRLYVCPMRGAQADLFPIDDAAIAYEEGRLTYVGPESALPQPRGLESVLDARRALVFPGFVECHTHLGFAGSRADEFGMRLQGASYLEIAERGGGIQRTVRATRAASDDELRSAAAHSLRAMRKQGITTVECKSGYGLSVEHEIRLLRLYQELEVTESTRIVKTFLGAHVPPPEFRGRNADYIEVIKKEMLPTIAREGLASFCDIFVEKGAFSPDDARDLLATARVYGLKGKLHIDQITDQGGGALARELGVTSADHLEHLSQAGMAALADSEVVAVALPLAGFFLRQPALAARAMIRAGIPVAVSTDFNPGSAPSHCMGLALLLSCVVQGMTAQEALKGATILAARALAVDHDRGSLEVGKYADFFLVDAPSEEAFVYEFGLHPARDVHIGGQRVSD
jgi:imidazolonepropionase